jgi:hypothetical protein
MVKPIQQECFLTEANDLLCKSNSFIYCITLDIFYLKENRYELGGVKYISSPTQLTFKKKYKVLNKTKELLKVINVEWVAAPAKFIEQNNLQRANVEKIKKSKKVHN